MAKKRVKRSKKKALVDGPPISAKSKRVISKWHRCSGTIRPDELDAMIEDDLLVVDPRRGFYKLSPRGREEYLIHHGEYPRDPRRRRPAMVQYD